MGLPGLPRPSKYQEKFTIVGLPMKSRVLGESNCNVEKNVSASNKVQSGAFARFDCTGTKCGHRFALIWSLPLLFGGTWFGFGGAMAQYFLHVAQTLVAHASTA